MARSPYPAVRIRVERPTVVAGSPRGPRTSPVADDALRDDARTTGVNAQGTITWGRSVAPVTGRKARKSPGWSSKIAGGSHIVAAGV